MGETVKDTRNLPPFEYGMASDFPYAGGFDETHAEAGLLPAKFTPPPHGPGAVVDPLVGVRHSATYIPTLGSKPLPETRTEAPVVGRFFVGLTDRLVAPFFCVVAWAGELRVANNMTLSANMVIASMVSAATGRGRRRVESPD